MIARRHLLALNHDVTPAARIANDPLRRAVLVQLSEGERRAAEAAKEAAREAAAAAGLGIDIFVEISLERQNDAALRAFEAALAACPNVLSCHLMSGSSDYLIHMAARDLPDFERLHANVLGHLPGVARIESKFALRSVIDRPLTPIGP